MCNRCISKVFIYRSLLSSYGVEIFAGYNISQKKLEAIFLTKLKTFKPYDRNIRGRIQISLTEAPLRKKAHRMAMQGFIRQELSVVIPVCMMLLYCVNC